jgi:NADPH-dependent 2,4-dienoyl-CoA reductase/sulfur reductase-like enzyme
MAEMLVTRGIDVTFLVREKSYWDMVLPPEESAMINRHIREHHVDLRLGTELAEILPDESGRVCAVRTSTGDEVPCQWVGLTAGVHPNIGFLKGSEIETDRGILVSPRFETNIPDVYAIGDCAQYITPPPGRRHIEQIWYTGKMHGETVAMNVCGKPMDYNPGVFFNSAKFFDIEYQIYGEVPAELPESMDTLYWEHPNGHHAIRLNWDRATGAIKGFHLMGIRYRHLVCERWIVDRTHVDEVVRNLRAANFDPEFFHEYEPAFVRLYNEKTGSNIAPEKRSRLASLIFGKRKDGRKALNANQ